MTEYDIKSDQQRIISTVVPEFVQYLTNKKIIRFFAVSGLNTLFGYGLFALFLRCRLAYPLALFFATIGGILFNFKTIGILVFKNHNNILLFKFFAVYAVTFLCNLGGLAIFRYFDINIYLGGAILLIPVGFLAFFLNRTFVFK